MSVLKAVGSVVDNVAENVASQKISDKFNELADTKFHDPRLKSKIYEFFKKKYGNEPFYNDFTNYLDSYNVIDNTLAMFYNTTDGILSKADFVEKHLRAFLDAFTKYCEDVIAMMQLESALGELYSIIEKAKTYISPHTDSGRLAMRADIHQSELLAEMRKNEQKAEERHNEVKTWIQGITNANPSPVNERVLSETIANDIKDCSQAIKEFEKKIECVSKKEFSYENENAKITEFLSLLAEIPTKLYNEPREHINKLICSLYCRIAICYCNLGKHDEALANLYKIPANAQKENKLYHYVFSLIIAVHRITERFDEAIESANKALQIDHNYHRVYLTRSFLYALTKKMGEEELLLDIDGHFKTILETEKDTELISEYYLYRGFICNEYDNYKEAVVSFESAKNNGYDKLISDYNIGMTYYIWACERVPRNKRVFCADVDIDKLCKVVEIFKEWLFCKDATNFIPYIKAKAVGIYVSACMFLGISHGLKPVEEYIKLPDLEYEAIRLLIVTSDNVVSETVLDMLQPEDKLHAKITNYIRGNNISGAKKCFTDLSDGEKQSLSQPIKIMFLQMCIHDEDIENYEKYRSYLDENENSDMLECMDAYVAALKGDIDTARKTFEKFANSSTDYITLRNILTFYARHNLVNEQENILLRIFDLYVEKEIYIADKEYFYIEAISFFTQRRSKQVLKFIEQIDLEDIDRKAMCSAKAIFYSSINDVPNMLECTSELYDITHKEKYALNSIYCLIKLFRYSDALKLAKELFDQIPDSNIDEKEKIFWLISDLYLYLNDLENSNKWALKAHTFVKENPYKDSHLQYLNRSIRTHHDEGLKEILEYKNTHPVVVDWLKEVKVSTENNDGNAFIKALSDASGRDVHNYEKQQNEILKLYKKSIPSNYFLLKYYNYDLSNFFIFAYKNRIRIAGGNLTDLYEQERIIEDDVVIDAITLITMRHYKCFEALQNIKRIHINYATLDVLQAHFLTLNYGYVADILEWLKSAENVIFENDSIFEYDSENNIFTYEFTACCNIAANLSVPLLTIETIASSVCSDPESKLPSPLTTVSINAFCEKVMSNDSEKLNQMLYELMAGCTFINFNCDTIFSQLRKNDYAVDTKLLSPFMTCNTSCDMLSFAKVYLEVIKRLNLINSDVAISFATMVFDNAIKIWRKAEHDRWVCNTAPNKISEYRVYATNQYLVFLIFEFSRLELSTPIELQNTISELQEKIVRDFGNEYIRELSSSF